MKSTIKSKEVSRKRRVCFEWPDESAREVSVVGTFNEWEPAASKMSLKKGQTWKRFVNLAPGSYEYLFVVDGEYRTDPKATEQTGNPFGGVNSLLQVSTTA